MPAPPEVTAVEALDLPEWLGTRQLTWTAHSSVRGASLIAGSLAPSDASGLFLPCDLMAADVAFPQPILPETWRRQAHLAWEYGQVQLVTVEGRLTLAVPGTAYSADGVLESIGRLALAVGVPAARFTVCLRL